MIKGVVLNEVLKMTEPNQELDPVHITIQVYDRLTNRYADVWFADPVMEEMLDKFLVRMGAPGLILDAGCGPGRDVLSMQRRGFKSIGIDLCSGMVEMASRLVPDGTFIVMDMRHLKFPDNIFSGIWACASLQHLPETDAAQAMSEFSRVTCPNGVVALIVDEGEGAFYDELGRYRKRYRIDEMERLLLQRGFYMDEALLVPGSKNTTGSNKGKMWLHVLARRSANAT